MVAGSGGAGGAEASALLVAVTVSSFGVPVEVSFAGAQAKHAIDSAMEIILIKVAVLLRSLRAHATTRTADRR